MTEHLRDTRLNTDIPVAYHYNSGHPSENMLFQILHILPTHPVDDRSTPRRIKCEKYWIYQLSGEPGLVDRVLALQAGS